MFSVLWSHLADAGGVIKSDFQVFVCKLAAGMEGVQNQLVDDEQKSDEIRFGERLFQKGKE